MIPGAIRRSLGLRAGDVLEAKLEASRIVLTPPRTHGEKFKVVNNPKTGIPVGYGSKSTATSRAVRDAMDEFP